MNTIRTDTESLKLDVTPSADTDTQQAGSPLPTLGATLAGGNDTSRMFVDKEGRLVVVASGGLWVENAKTFQHSLLGEITDSVRVVDLRLADIVRFDTWALCTLLSLRRYFSARLIRFRLVDPSPRVEMILEMTKTRQLFEVIRMSAGLSDSLVELRAHRVRPGGAV